MMKVFVIHYSLRKGLGPEWVNKTEEIAFDDLSEDTTDCEVKEMAIAEFKSIRHKKGTSEREYIINEVCES
jgi:hypothetical protein